MYSIVSIKDKKMGVISYCLSLSLYIISYCLSLFLDEIFFKKKPFLKHNLPVEILGDPPPPKGDPVFELKPLPDNLKYAYLDEKNIYPVIISANLSEQEEERLLKTLKKHRAAIGYTLDDIKGISPTRCQHKINMEPDARLVVDH